MPTHSKNIVIIGASTGGPKILGRIFSDLPLLNASILLVQHMPRFINKSLKETLSRNTDMDVGIAEDGELIRDGKIYVVPSEIHLQLLNNRKIYLTTVKGYICS